MLAYLFKFIVFLHNAPEHLLTENSQRPRGGGGGLGITTHAENTILRI